MRTEKKEKRKTGVIVLNFDETAVDLEKRNLGRLANKINKAWVLNVRRMSSVRLLQPTLDFIHGLAISNFGRAG